MLLRFSLLALLLLFSSSVTGEEKKEDAPRWFQFEIIIFEYADDKGFDSELWPEDPTLANYDAAQELLPASVLPLFTKPQPLSELDIPLDLPAHDDTIETSELRPETELVVPSLDVNAQNNLANALPSKNNRAIEITPERPFMLLAETDRSLNNLAAEFNRKSEYKLLYHQAWRQPVAKPGKATAIRTSSLTGNLDHLLGVYDLHQEKNLSLSEDHPIILRPPELEIDGMITPSLNRYLHLKLQLVYRKRLLIEMTEQETMNSLQDDFLISSLSEDETLIDIESVETHRYQNFSMETKRRMRSKQLHYFDHPLFGVLALITPYELAVNSEVDDADEGTLMLPE
ncbi:hypothetical protein MNBD_GAMMA16-657 [hydrothermal vent metagenome]|uniref:Peptidoglycan-binding protein CsiV n=1 Tax=hydrothermal vent metagenome TaxID=652676 RepID=A0A3B1A5V1_9ZZZZ